LKGEALLSRAQVILLVCWTIVKKASRTVCTQKLLQAIPKPCALHDFGSIFYNFCVDTRGPQTCHLDSTTSRFPLSLPCIGVGANQPAAP